MAFACILGAVPAGESQLQFVTLENDAEEFFNELEELFASDPIHALTHEPSHSPGGCDLGGLDEALACLLRRRSHPALGGYALDDSDVSPVKSVPALPRSSPFVGFWRHAPASPPLSFISNPESLMLPILKAKAQPGMASLPDLVLSKVLNFVLELRDVGHISACFRHSLDTLRSPATWSGRTVRIEPQMLGSFAPHLRTWLPAWTEVSRLVIPKSRQLLDQLTLHAPALPVDISWRFDMVLKGDGVEVSRGGTMARRIGEEELVVLGDAPLSRVDGRLPYFEVVLEDRSEAVGDCLNDFGIGVTACNPIEVEVLGDVADEFPRSWVIDFTKRSTTLSVNNEQLYRTEELTAEDLTEGDRIGILVQLDALEVFVNGVVRARFALVGKHFLEQHEDLYPVIDLYGQSVQISVSNAEEPNP